MSLTPTCKNCSKTFEISDSDLEFIKKVSPVIAGKKYELPSPTLCPDCRFQRRAAWRNDRNLFERTCDISGQRLISMYDPDAPVKVIHKDLWWGDSWDPLDYGRDYDFNKPFFQQFQELDSVVPHANVILLNSENSLYTNYNMQNKNCYLCFGGNFLQDSLYCYFAEESRDCVDCFFVCNAELCYECVHCNDCYNVKFSRFSKDCTDCSFVEDCIGCKDCFLCFNLSHKQYYILNKQYTKEAYEKKMAQYDLTTRSGIEKVKKLFEEESKKFPKRENHNINAEDCTGELISQSKNCHDCFIMTKECEDCRYVFNGLVRLKDSQDCTCCGEDASLMYESIASGSRTQGLLFDNIVCDGSVDTYYSRDCFRIKNSFGCTQLRNKEYCILNKQYTREEYENLLPRIVKHMVTTGEWGEFFPISMSPFAYHDTFAQEIFPLIDQEIQNKNYRFRPQVIKEYQPATATLPDTITETSDTITQAILACANCKKNYKITTQEFRFYLAHNLPAPDKCFDCRHIARMHQRNTPHFYTRNCSKCSTQIRTTYRPDRPEQIYCEKCYREAIY